MVIHNFNQIQGQVLQFFQLIFDAPNSRDYWYIVYIIKLDFFVGMGCNFWWFRPVGYPTGLIFGLGRASGLPKS